MKKYKVKVNGRVFEVELEAVSEEEGHVGAPDAPKAPAAGTEKKTIVTPIAGKVLAIKVKVGDLVKVGQTVAVIEAMKLENEVPATVEGTVVEICVAKGAAVNNRDALIVLA